MATLSDWQKVKIGDNVSLRDEQTLIELMESGKLEVELNVTVMSVIKYQLDTDGDFYYLLVQFEEKPDIAVVIKVCDDCYDLMVCFTEIKPDTLVKMEYEYPWMFGPDDDFSESIYDGNDVKFSKEYEVSCYDDENVYTVAEYHATEECENPIALIMYAQNLEDESRNLLRFWQGVQVTDNDVRLNFIGG